MDMLLVSVTSQEKRENQYLADVAQENVERERRNEKLWTQMFQRTEQLARHTSEHPRKAVSIQ